MSKNSGKATSPLDKFDFNDDMMDHPIIQWLTRHRQTILYSFLALIAVVSIIYRYLSREASNAETAYTQATIEFNRFQDAGLAATEPVARDEAFTNLQQLMNQYPELHAKYDGLIAETLIIEGKPDEAQSFAQLSFDRTQHDDSPFYTDFAKTTLVVSRGSYDRALQEAHSLQERMVAQLAVAQQNRTTPTFGPTLFTLNLIRVAVLQQQLGNKEGELKAWEELKRLTTPGKSAFDPAELKEAVALFSEGRATLTGYIEHRIRALGT